MQVLPNIRFPELLNDDDKIIGASFVLPDAALAEVPGHAPAKTPQPEKPSSPMR